MLLSTHSFSEPGERAFIFEGPMGTLEGICVIPEVRQTHEIAMLGHPHSLQGGSMSNKVVTTLARALRDVGVPSVRFNFRGVGGSQGEFNHGLGESEDMLALMSHIETLVPAVNWILAGFSFGSYVTYRAALKRRPRWLLSIAPPIERYDYTQDPGCPWIIIQGDADEVVDSAGVFDFAAKHRPPLKIIRFEDTSHFFHGKLLSLRETVEKLYHELT
jgi:alpha/beta superfamily hydrolase